VDADEVNQALCDERQVFVLRVEQLAHGDRRTRLLAQQAEMVVVFGRERVLQKEQPKLLDVFAQSQRLRRRDLLVHVMHDLDFVAERRTHCLQHLEEISQIRFAIP